MLNESFHFYYVSAKHWGLFIYSGLTGNELDFYGATLAVSH